MWPAWLFRRSVKRTGCPLGPVATIAVVLFFGSLFGIPETLTLTSEFTLPFSLSHYRCDLFQRRAVAGNLAHHREHVFAGTESRM